MEVGAEQDPAAVRAVHTAAFKDDGHVADLADALRSDPATLSLVATEGGTVAGHVMFSRCLLDAPQRLVEVFSLSPLGVLPAFQRRGIGRELIRRGLAEMDARGVPLVFLEGDPFWEYDAVGLRP